MSLQLIRLNPWCNCNQCQARSTSIELQRFRFSERERGRVVKGEWGEKGDSANWVHFYVSVHKQSQNFYQLEKAKTNICDSYYILHEFVISSA